MSSPSDPTFRSYDSEQAQKYAESRLSYPVTLYDAIIKFHTQSEGQTHILVDVGCGPGNATRDLALHFDHVIGLDPSVEMIKVAGESGSLTKSGLPLKFAVSTAEDLVKNSTSALPAIKENGGVDLLTAAMAAHWFDMAKFWEEAARIVRPQGTVALWTCASLYCHPSTVNAKRVQEILFHLERDVLSTYSLPSNQISDNLYKTLIHPWELNDDGVAKAFPRSAFKRVEWNRDGIMGHEDNFLNATETTLDQLEKGLGTASMVTRWREAHPNLEGTDQDCVVKAMIEIRNAMGRSRHENPVIVTGSAVALLLFKRSQNKANGR